MPAAGTTPGATVNGDRFAKVPRTVVLELAKCPPCLVLYAWLAVELGGTDWERTVTAGAKALRWERHTAYRHARDLAVAGLIELECMGSGSSSRMRLTPNLVAKRPPLMEGNETEWKTSQRKSNRGFH